MAASAADGRGPAAAGGESFVKTKIDKADGPIRLFATQGQWAEWLEKNHRKSAGLWLRLAKKESGRGR